MADIKEIPTPQITCFPDGHRAICPVCTQQFLVPTSEVPNLVKMVDANGSEVMVTRGSTTDYDMSVYEGHYRNEH